jgi:hypothetical protein
MPSIKPSKVAMTLLFTVFAIGIYLITLAGYTVFHVVMDHLGYRGVILISILTPSYIAILIEQNPNPTYGLVYNLSLALIRLPILLMGIAAVLGACSIVFETKSVYSLIYWALVPAIIYVTNILMIRVELLTNKFMLVFLDVKDRWTSIRNKS